MQRKKGIWIKCLFWGNSWNTWSELQCKHTDIKALYLSRPWGLFPGMTSRDFRGIHSIQEVECWGADLNTDVKLISLQLFELPQSNVLASLNVFTNNCMTYGEFSSCVIHPSESHRSRLRVLVHDLEEGESREYGCTSNTINPQGNSIYKNSKILLRRNSK